MTNAPITGDGDGDMLDDATSAEIQPTGAMGDGDEAHADMQVDAPAPAESEGVLGVDDVDGDVVNELVNHNDEINGAIIFCGFLSLIYAEAQRQKTTWMAMKIMVRNHGPNVNILFISDNLLNHSAKVVSSFVAQSGGMGYFQLNSKFKVHHDTIRRHTNGHISADTRIRHVFTLANTKQLDKMADLIQDSMQYGQKWIIIVDEADRVLPFINDHEQMDSLIAANPSSIKIVGVTATIPSQKSGWVKMRGSTRGVRVRPYVPKSPHYTRLVNMKRHYFVPDDMPEQAKANMDSEIMYMVDVAMMERERSGRDYALNVFVPHKTQNKDHDTIREKLLHKYQGTYVLTINQNGMKMYGPEGVLIATEALSSGMPTGENEYDKIKSLYQKADAHAGKRADVFIVGRNLVKRCMTIHGEGRALTHIVVSRYFYRDVDDGDERANDVYQLFARTCGSFPMQHEPVIFHTSEHMFHQAVSREGLAKSFVGPEGRVITLEEVEREAAKHTKNAKRRVANTYRMHPSTQSARVTAVPAPPQRRTLDESGAGTSAAPTPPPALRAKRYHIGELGGTMAEMWSKLMETPPPQTTPRMTQVDKANFKSGVVEFKVVRSERDVSTLRVITEMKRQRKAYFNVEYHVTSQVLRMVPYDGDIEALRQELCGENAMDLLKSFLSTYGHEYRGSVFTYPDLDKKMKERMPDRYNVIKSRCAAGRVILFGERVESYAREDGALIERVVNVSPAMYKIK